jgi:hypothetical protein
MAMVDEAEGTQPAGESLPATPSAHHPCADVYAEPCPHPGCAFVAYTLDDLDQHEQAVLHAYESDELELAASSTSHKRSIRHVDIKETRSSHASKKAKADLQVAAAAETVVALTSEFWLGPSRYEPLRLLEAEVVVLESAIVAGLSSTAERIVACGVPAGVLAQKATLLGALNRALESAAARARLHPDARADVESDRHLTQTSVRLWLEAARCILALVKFATVHHVWLADDDNEAEWVSCVVFPGVIARSTGWGHSEDSRSQRRPRPDLLRFWQERREWFDKYRVAARPAKQRAVESAILTPYCTGKVDPLVDIVLEYMNLGRILPMAKAGAASSSSSSTALSSGGEDEDIDVESGLDDCAWPDDVCARA